MEGAGTGLKDSWVVVGSTSGLEAGLAVLERERLLLTGTAGLLCVARAHLDSEMGWCCESSPPLDNVFSFCDINLEMDTFK